MSILWFMDSDNMMQFQQCQRLYVGKETQGAEKTLKITVERYDECLGWYTAGALTLPLHQLPLLQQALHDICVTQCEDCDTQDCPRKIIPFPTLGSEGAAACARKVE